MLVIPLTLVDVTVMAALAFWCNLLRQRSAGKHPPGPNGYPVIGNMFEMSVSEIWEVAVRKWGKTYGSLIYLRSLGQSVVVINSYDTASELLEKRSLNYSDRPRSVMLNELQRWDWVVSTKNYGDELRRLRTPLQKFFEPTNLVQFDSVLERDAEKLLRELLRDPKTFETHIKTAIASPIMSMTYGHEVESYEDRFLRVARDSVEEINRAYLKGLYLVDILPWLKHLPKWFPGAGFQAVAEKGARLSHDVQYLPFHDARDKILSGMDTEDSFTRQQLQRCQRLDGRLSMADEDHISAMSGICYLAGAETTISAFMSFLLAMILFPEVQRRAQAEIDQVVGRDRLPKLSDRLQLPYCVAVCKEIQRWGSVTPMGLAHATKENSYYNGYVIPAKSIIMPNQWAMLHDPEEYPDPHAFRPERFLPTTGERLQRDPMKIAFGFGRRVCPGRFLAENIIFAMVIRSLAVLDFSKSLDSEGKPIECTAKFTTDGIVRHPLSFDCSIKPRSKEMADLVQNIME